MMEDVVDGCCLRAPLRPIGQSEAGADVAALPASELTRAAHNVQYLLRSSSRLDAAKSSIEALAEADVRLEDCALWRHVQHL